MPRDKKQKWSKNRKRLRDALVSNAYNNQLSKMLENFAMLRPDEFESCKSGLLTHALKNASKECAQILIEKGAICDPNRIMYDCDWKVVDKVHTLMIELIEKYDVKFLKESNSPYFLTDKKSIIARLIEPAKIDANIERAEYVLKLMNDGFFTPQDVREVYNQSYKDKNKGKMVMLIRELTLNELGL